MQVHVCIDGVRLNIVRRILPGQQIRCLGDPMAYGCEGEQEEERPHPLWGHLMMLPKSNTK